MPNFTLRILFDSTHPICWLVLGRWRKVIVFQGYYSGLMDGKHRGSGLLTRNLFSVNPELKLDVTHAQDKKCKHALLNKISEKRIDLMHYDVILWSRRLKSFENGYS